MMVGCPNNSSLEAIYNSRTPHAFALKLTVTERRLLGEEEASLLVSVLKDHGLQPHANNHSGTTMGVYREETQWGVQQHLNTNTLPQGLLKPVVTRLIAAMKDATTTHGKQKP